MNNESNKVTFELGNLDTLAPLYLQYPGQCNPQSAHVEMDETGVITADSDSGIGNSMSGYVWHDRTIQFTCLNSVSGSALKEYLNHPDTIKEFQEIHDLHEVDWDGSNHVGIITAEMRTMIESIESELEQLEQCEIWDVSDWIENAEIEEVWHCTDTLEDAVAALIQSAKDDNIHLVGDVEEALKDKKDAE